ncbi:hypothetical protein [Streptomyces sp. NBC_00557]|uniref:hypothetical protein n=1 Tax=Streptomyces sp. NBC_00557 TaxID=2975776 RepID=UPI002E80ED8C|nr:hypothetical protein [Streptomyces sp. NBC_00557]WUC32791.1 hypothetical protein OG956_00395 [Streptomyces sp. NBC_00557]
MNTELVDPFGLYEEERFLTHYKTPVNAGAEEPVNRLRLPLLDRGWNDTTAD